MIRKDVSSSKRKKVLTAPPTLIQIQETSINSNLFIKNTRDEPLHDIDYYC